MKPLYIKIIAIVASVLLLGSATVGVVTLVNQDKSDDRINTQEEQIEAINSSITDLKALDTQLDGYIDALEATAAELETKLTAANKALEDAKTEIYAEIDAESAAMLAQLTTEKETLTAELAKTNKALEDAKAANTASEKAISDTITALEAELEKADADNKKALENSIASLESALTTADAANKAALEESISALETALQKADADNKKALEDSIASLNTTLSALITTNATDIDALETTATGLQAQIDELHHRKRLVRIKADLTRKEEARHIQDQGGKEGGGNGSDGSDLIISLCE